MNDLQQCKLIILTGPSCVGKSPLAKALLRFYPEKARSLQPLVLYNSRPARPGEKDGIDYHFRTRSEISTFETKENFVLMNVRGDLQAIDIKELKSNLSTQNVFFEGNPIIGRYLQTSPEFSTFEKLGIFMSPLSSAEILELKAQEPKVELQELITDIMRRKLLRRTRRQKGELALPDLQNIETRASSAFHELKLAHHFPYIIANHDGEDSENWDAFYHLIGDARKALLAFVALLSGEVTSNVEKWEVDMFSD